MLLDNKEYLTIVTYHQLFMEIHNVVKFPTEKMKFQLKALQWHEAVLFQKWS